VESCSIFEVFLQSVPVALVRSTIEPAGQWKKSAATEKVTEVFEAVWMTVIGVRTAKSHFLDIGEMSRSRVLTISTYIHE
jgi:hypothetical protein